MAKVCQPAEHAGLAGGTAGSSAEVFGGVLCPCTGMAESESCQEANPAVTPWT
jgi:hypothetical protein